MKVMKVQIPNLIKNVALTAPLFLATQGVVAQRTLQKDVFEKEPKSNNELVNTDNVSFPAVKIAGTTVYPALVLDLSEKQMYHYDLGTDLVDVYPINFVEDKIKTGINLVDVAKHQYNDGTIVEKIYLTPVNKLNGRPAEAPTQVIVGDKDSNLENSILFTNVIFVDNNDAKKITEFLTEEQFVLIRK